MNIEFYLCKRSKTDAEHTEFISDKPIYKCNFEDVDTSIFPIVCDQNALKKEFGEADLAERNLTDLGYPIFVSDIKRNISKGFVSGYALSKDVKAYYQKKEEGDDVRFAHDEMDIIPLEVFVEFDDRKRKSYEKFAFLDTLSRDER